MQHVHSHTGVTTHPVWYNHNADRVAQQQPVKQASTIIGIPATALVLRHATSGKYAVHVARCLQEVLNDVAPVACETDAHSLHVHRYHSWCKFMHKPVHKWPAPHVCTDCGLRYHYYAEHATLCWRPFRHKVQQLHDWLRSISSTAEIYAIGPDGVVSKDGHTLHTRTYVCCNSSNTSDHRHPVRQLSGGNSGYASPGTTSAGRHSHNARTLAGTTTQRTTGTRHTRVHMDGTKPYSKANHCQTTSIPLTFHASTATFSQTVRA